jgi:putative transposase
MFSQGASLSVILKKIGGGMRVEQAKRLKELEQENSRLKKLVADLSLDNAILK